MFNLKDLQKKISRKKSQPDKKEESCQSKVDIQKKLDEVYKNVEEITTEASTVFEILPQAKGE